MISQGGHHQTKVIKNSATSRISPHYTRISGLCSNSNNRSLGAAISKGGSKIRTIEVLEGSSIKIDLNKAATKWVLFGDRATIANLILLNSISITRDPPPSQRGAAMR